LRPPKSHITITTIATLIHRPTTTQEVWEPEEKVWAHDKFDELMKLEVFTCLAAVSQFNR
jgi:hypothetical protein